MTWQEDFTADGSLRDIVVRDSTRADWFAVLQLVESRYPPVRFVDRDQTSDRVDSQRIFVASESRPTLLFTVGTIELACHFFDENEIEFDFSPNDIRTEEDLAPILRFVAEIGGATGKPAAITPENLHEVAIFQFSPASGTVHYLAV